MCFSLWPWVAWSFTAVMSLCRAAFILSLYVSSMLHRISVLERARVLSHVALRLRQNRGTSRSTRRMATFSFFSVASDRTCMSHPHSVIRPQDLSALTDRCALSKDLWRHTSFSHVQVTSGEIERVSNIVNLHAQFDEQLSEFRDNF